MSSLTSYLAKKGAVNPARLQKALLNQAIKGGSTSLSLLEVEAISDERLVEMTGKFFRLSTITIAGCLSADPDVVALLPAARCEDLGILAVDRDGDGIVVACVEPPSGTALELLERDAPDKLTFVIASPVGMALALALHLDLGLDPRILAIVRRDGPLELEGIGEKVAGALDALLGRAESTPEPEEEEDDDDDWEEDEDEEDEEDDETEEEDDEWEEDEDEVDEPPAEGRSSLVGKYIIVNRIGARKRLPSVQVDVPESTREPVQAEERRLEEDDSTDVTFTDGSLRASRDTRPGRPSSVPPPPAEPKRTPSVTRTRPESVPAAILKEVVQEYLEDDFTPPRRAGKPRLQVRPEPVPEPAAPKAEDVRVTRTVAVTPQPTEPVRVETPREEPPPERPKPETKTLHGMAVLDGIRSAPEGAVQGYSVDVPEILSLSEVLAEIEESESAAEVTDVVHRYALQFFDFVLMMRYRRGRFELAGVSSRGWSWPLDRLPTQIMGYDQLPESVRKVGQPHLGPVDEDGKIAEVIRAVGRPLPANGMLMPISLKGRAIVLLYGDNGERATSFDEVHDLFHATWVATNTLLALLEERRK